MNPEHIIFGKLFSSLEVKLLFWGKNIYSKIAVILN